MTPRILIMLLSSIALGAVGQLLFKGAARVLPGYSELGLVRMLVTMFTTPMILGGFTCFFVSSVLWIISLRSVNLNIAYPMVSLSYIIIFTGSYFLFKEPLDWRHWIGAALIVSGIVLITWRN